MKSKKGFTLVEIMIVILILGILAAVAVPIFRGEIGEQRYSKVVEYLQSNHCVKIDYPLRDKEICLTGEEGPGILFDLSNDSFFELKRKLEKGEGLMGIWTFESKDEAPAPGAVWHGTRSQKQKEI